MVTPASDATAEPQFAAVRETEVSHPSIGTLVKEATDQLSTLVRSELELAKAEVKGEVKKATAGSVMLIVGGVVALLAMPFLFVAAAEGLANAVPRWLAYLIIWALFIVIALALVFLGIKKMKKLRAPQRTIDSMKQNKQITAAFKKSEETTN